MASQSRLEQGRLVKIHTLRVSMYMERAITWVYGAGVSVSVWIHQLGDKHWNWIYHQMKISTGMGSAGADILFAYIDHNERVDYVEVAPNTEDPIYHYEINHTEHFCCSAKLRVREICEYTLDTLRGVFLAWLASQNISSYAIIIVVG